MAFRAPTAATTHGHATPAPLPSSWKHGAFSGSSKLSGSGSVGGQAGRLAGAAHRVQALAPATAWAASPPPNADYLAAEFSGHGVTFEAVGDSCAVKMAVRNGSAAHLLLPSGLVTSYKPAMWHGAATEVLHTTVGEGPGGRPVIRGGVSMDFRCARAVAAGGDAPPPSSWSPGGGVVAPRREGRPDGVHLGGAGVRGAAGERGRGGGEVRGDAAAGGAGVGVRGDQRRVVVVGRGAVGRRVQPPAREHARRHLRRGAPGLGLPRQGAPAVGVQHPAAGLLRGADVVLPAAALGQQGPRHAPLRRRRRGRAGGTGAGRRGGRQLQAPDGGAVPGLPARAQGVHRHRQGPEELGLPEQERVRGAVRLQPRIQVRVVREVCLRVHRACHAGARGAAAGSHVARGAVHPQPKPVDVSHHL
uniref:Predicted protein n=1 Tax=Hordeum vulgare subsp. vulgare TaxID=112509 RepID=F2D6S0_HORVV|nr:predicted protein [Hordeum vulgare subsp. vulgare]